MGLIVGTQETWLRLARLGAQPSEGRQAGELHLAVGHEAQHGEVQRVRRLPGCVASSAGIRSDRRRQPANCSCRTWSRSDELIAPRAGEGGQPPPWTLTYLWIPGSGEVRSGIPGSPWLPWCSAALAVGACPATVHLLEAAGRPPSRHVCVGAVHTCRCCRSRRVSGRWAVSVVRTSRQWSSVCRVPLPCPLLHHHRSGRCRRRQRCLSRRTLRLRRSAAILCNFCRRCRRRRRAYRSRRAHPTPGDHGRRAFDREIFVCLSLSQLGGVQLILLNAPRLLPFCGRNPGDFFAFRRFTSRVPMPHAVYGVWHHGS